jgi:hypothetical protein
VPSRPAPPLAIELSRSVAAAARRDPTLTATLNAVLLRAARALRARIAGGEGHIRLSARREGVVLDLVLAPPDGCRIESVAPLDGDETVDLAV